MYKIGRGNKTDGEKESEHGVAGLIFIWENWVVFQGIREMVFAERSN